MLGYRALYVDFEKGAGNTLYEYDMLTHGPVIGSDGALLISRIAQHLYLSVVGLRSSKNTEELQMKITRRSAALGGVSLLAGAAMSRSAFAQQRILLWHW